MTKDPVGGAISEIERRIWLEIRRVADRIALMLEKSVSEVLNENDKVVSGDLEKSVSSRVIEETNRIIISVFTGLPYAKYVHEGTGPAAGHSEYKKLPPIFPIARWVQKKGIGQSFSVKSKRMIGSNYKRKMHKVGGTELSSKFSQEVLSVAYAIQRSIGKKGTAGVKFFEIALKRSEARMQQMVNEAVSRIAAA